MAVGHRFGVDLSGVRVDRSSRAATAAQRMGASAFTSDLSVVIPESAGSLDRGPGAALLAHELTHVAQRARFGPNMAITRSPAQAGLETQAEEVEADLSPVGVRARPPAIVSGRPHDLPLDIPGRTEPPSAFAPPAAAVASQGLTQGRRPLPLASGPASRPGTGSAAQLLEAATTWPRGSAFDPPETSPQRKVVLTPGAMVQGGATNPALPQAPAPPVPAPPVPAPPVPAPPVQAAPTPQLAAGAVQAASASPPAPPAPQPSAPPPAPSSSPFATRPSDADLAKLATWLYPLMLYKLRAELRENRERQGLITDNYRRW